MDIQDIRRAATTIKPYIKRTPLQHSRSLSERLGTDVYVKFELFQRTGAFKVRGAFNKLLSMSEADRRKGVVAVSGGNHAQAVALAAADLGVDAVILMPENTPKSYLEATRGYGAVVELTPTIKAAFDRAADYQNEGRVFVHPFDDELVIAGQGTVGIEIVEDLPDVTDVIVSIGGGGLASGVAIAVKEQVTDAHIWGVETVGADAMSQAVAAGHPVELPAITSIAKTLGAPFVSERTLNYVRKYLGSVTVVDDAEAVAAIHYLAERLKVITEPAAACTLAAAERLKDKFGPTSKVVLVLCGGNTSISDICGYAI